MDDLHCSAVFLKHTMLELFGRVVVEGCVKRWRIDLV